MDDDLPSVRLDEVPGLADVTGHLRELSVRDVMIRPTVLPDGRTVWTGLVVLNGLGGAMPWMLGARDSEGSARAAMETFLAGVVAARLNTMKLHPRADDVDCEAAVVAIIETANGMCREWIDRNSPPPADPAPPPRRQPRPARVGNGGRPYDEVDLDRWCSGLREVRLAWKMTQAQLAERVNVTQAQVSQIERRQWRPPVQLAEALSEILDIEPPRLSESTPGPTQGHK